MDKSPRRSVQVAQERAAIRGQEQRRTMVDSAIAAFRPQMENLIGSVTDNASTMRGTASSLFDSSQQTSERAADTRSGCSLVLAPIQRRYFSRIDRL